MSANSNLKYLLTIRDEHHQAAKRLHAAITAEDIDVLIFFADLSPKLLKHTAIETSAFSTAEMSTFLRFLSRSNLISSAGIFELSRLVISVASELAPLITVITPMGTKPSSVDKSSFLVKTYFMSTLDTMMNGKNSFFKVAWGKVTGTYLAINSYDRHKIREGYFSYFSGNKIPASDLPWFGSEWKIVLTVWDRLELAGCFERSYAESLIKEIADHGPTLADGVL